MKALITGAAGFIGSHLYDRLEQDGDTVIGVDNYLTGREEWLPRVPALDICDDKFVRWAIEKQPDVIFHCAASYSDPLKWHRDTETNVKGTINCAIVARETGAKLVYFQTALPPVTSYAISKIAGEHYITVSGVDHLVFRLANIYGPRNLSGPIPTFYKRLTAGERCTVVDTVREMVFVDDLVAGVFRALDRGVSGKYDMCAGSAYRIVDLFDAVAAEVGHDGRPDEIPAPADDVPKMQLSPELAMYGFQWAATTELTEGVRRAVDWYRSHGVDQTFTHLNLKG